MGFRPFVYRLARELGIRGWVRNRGGMVEILAEAPPQALENFARRLLDDAPPVADPQELESLDTEPSHCPDFRIVESGLADVPEAHLPPDLYACPDCLREISDPADRRYRYPFTNCTHCGPRYTLIRALPYDRSRTAMAGFELCPNCAAEYADPADRRFHAEPVACPRCGPRLRFEGEGGTSLRDEQALSAAVTALREGRILAVKGVGGYHLMCDATDAAAVERLRRRKPRPHKPLAVLFPDPEGPQGHWLQACVNAEPEALALLRSPARPIVLMDRREDCPLPPAIAPGLREIGVLLPYSPLHQLLVEAAGRPLVATSGNRSGEPVLTDEAAATAGLAHVADAFLHHDRPIERPADDALFRVIAGRPRALRPGRGTAPLELSLPFRLERPVLALGAQLKATLTLAWEDRAVVTPHIGDLGTLRGLEVLARLADDLQALYGVSARALICDAHPDYASTRWAREQGLPVHAVHHHLAHASALAGEHPGPGDWLVFTWDGTGLGTDGTLWGGEALLGGPGRWRRVASLRPFRLPGGERTALAPWRSAAALCWERSRTPPFLPEEGGLLRQAWERDLNCTSSSSAGRLFDAAASLTGLLQEASFDGQAPMWLETLAQEAPGTAIELPLQRGEDGLWLADWAPLLAHLADPTLPPVRRAADFHASLARVILEQALAVRKAQGFERVGLTGGVFQNRLLSETALAQLEAAGFEVCLSTRLPANDGGISFGQVMEYGVGRSNHD